MAEYDFQMGDIVQVNELGLDGRRDTVGLTGEIVFIKSTGQSGYEVGVVLEGYTHGWDLNILPRESKSGLYGYFRQIELVHRDSFDPTTIKFTFDSLKGWVT